MNILLIHNFYSVKGGEDVVVLNQKKVLEEAGHTIVDLFRFTEDEKVRNIFQYFRLFLSSIFSLKSYLALQLLLKKKSIDVAYVHNIFPLHSLSVLLALKNSNVPIVLSLHNYRYFSNKNNLFLWRNVYYLFTVVVIALAKIIGLFSLINLFVVPSNFMHSVVVSAGIPQDKIVVIPHFVLDDKPTISNKKLRKTFLYLGRISYEKGIDRLYDFFRTNPQYQLILATPYISEKSRGRWLTLRNIRVVQNLSKVGIGRLLSRVTALLVPSRWDEPFGLVVIEAMQKSTISIVTEKGALPELVEHGRTGFILSNQSDKFDSDLSDVIRLVVRNPQLVHKMGIIARKKARTVFSSKRFVESITDAFRKALT